MLLKLREHNQAKAIQNDPATQSLYEFVRAAWPIIESSQYVDNWHIHAICDHLQAVTKGQIDKLLINIPPGCSKPCYNGGMILEKTKGRIRLGDAVVGDEVLTHRGRFRKVLAIHEQGVLPTLKLTTFTGRELIVAPDHPLLTPQGWTQAKDLLIGDTLAEVHSQEPSGTDTITAEAARLLGYLIGDGCVKNQTAEFTNQDKSVLDDFVLCAESCGFRTRFKKTPPSKMGKLKAQMVVLLPVVPDGKKWYVSTRGPHPVWSWLEKHGIRHADSYTKRVPPAIMAGTQSLIAEFLGAYWSCDGFVAKQDGRASACCIGADTVSCGLASDVRHLLSRIGIQSRVRIKVNKKLITKKQGVGYTSYQIVVSSIDHGSKFARIVPMRQEKRTAEAAKYKRTGFDQILYGDQIVSVADAGENPCRCLTIEEDHSFAFEDIAVHNSTLVSVLWPAWEWANNASIRWFLASYDQRLSTRDSVKCRALLTSKWFQDRWPNKVVFRGDQDQKTYYETIAGGYRLATSVGGHGTGEHPDRIVIDDPTDVKGGASMADMQSVRDWWDLTMTTRGVSRGVRRVGIMQRISEDDFTAHVIQQGGWVHICLPMRFEKARMVPTPLGWTDPRIIEGELLTPKQFPESAVKQMEKILGVYGSTGQLQQRPTPKGGAKFKSTWFRRWERGIGPGEWRLLPEPGSSSPAKFIGPSNRFKLIFQVVDPAASEKTTADFTVIGTFGITTENELVWLDCERFQKEIPEIIPLMEIAYKKWNPAYVAVEAVAANNAVYKLANRTEMCVKCVSPMGMDKLTRATPAMIYASEGRVFLPINAHWLDDVESELLRFTGNDKLDAHDDIVDVLSMAAQALQGRLIHGAAAKAVPTVFKGK